MVFRYEDPWLTLAGELDWLRSIKSAIYLHGLWPNNLPYPLRRAHTPEELEKVRQCLEEVFGPIKKADL